MSGIMGFKSIVLGIQLLFAVLFISPAKKLVNKDYQEGKASYYGDEFEGRKTAFGEIFRNADFTAAHKSFPYNTFLRVTNLKNNLSVTVRVNDRGPFVKSRIIDLSESAARRIGSYMHGLATVKVEVLNIIQHTKEIDSLFSCYEVLDCLGNPDSIKNNSISLWKTKDLLHMLYIANELYLQEDVEKVLISGHGNGGNRVYELLITDIPDKKTVDRQIDYYERKGFMNVKAFPNHKS